MQEGSGATVLSLRLGEEDKELLVQAERVRVLMRSKLRGMRVDRSSVLRAALGEGLSFLEGFYSAAAEHSQMMVSPSPKEALMDRHEMWGLDAVPIDQAPPPPKRTVAEHVQEVSRKAHSPSPPPVDQVPPMFTKTSDGKWPVEAVAKVREMAGQGVSQSEIARVTGIKQPTVSTMIRGRGKHE